MVARRRRSVDDSDFSSLWRDASLERLSKAASRESAIGGVAGRPR
jgi:hypothetical protein